VITKTTTTGIKAFPKLDILLPFCGQQLLFTGSNFDVKAAELVGFQLCFELRMAEHQAWPDGCNFIQLRGYVNF